ncbi:uncharacterized protein VTP21DRAFT_4992 [Calcarisporiella thermophila]|uniref:uncharacterized protein n=1 Tax=Calcarisporiella thermophila TaxID=911321 RepID=UPI003743797B
MVIMSLKHRYISHSFECLIFVYFTYAYLLDSSLLNFATRCLTQFFISPRTITRTFHAVFFVIILSNLASVLRHITDIDNRGIIIDFIGQAHVQTRSYLLFTDAAIFSLQFVFLLITLLTAGTSLENTSEDREDEEDRPEDEQANSEVNTLSSLLEFSDRGRRDAEEEPEYALDIRLRPVLRNLIFVGEDERESPTPSVAQRRASMDV